MHLIVIFGLCLLFLGFARTFGAIALMFGLIVSVLGLFVLYDHIHNPNGWRDLNAVYEAQHQEMVQEEERRQQILRDYHP